MTEVRVSQTETYLSRENIAWQLQHLQGDSAKHFDTLVHMAGGKDKITQEQVNRLKRLSTPISTWHERFRWIYDRAITRKLPVQQKKKGNAEAA